MSMRNLLIAGLAATALFAPALLAEESYFTHSDEVEILFGTPFEQNVEIKGAGNAILEFKAWYRSKVPAGFYSMLNVTWNGQRLTEILDRPDAVYVEGLEREFQTRSDTGWLTAILPEPGAIEQPSPYYVSREVADLVTFRFKLPTSQPGIYPLQIINRLKDPEQKYFNQLIVSELRIYQAEE